MGKGLGRRWEWGGDGSEEEMGMDMGNVRIWDMGGNRHGHDITMAQAWGIAGHRKGHVGAWHGEDMGISMRGEWVSTWV